MRKAKGFSLIELLIVIAIILIIAAIAIPNLLRARMAANEASAVGSIRTMNTAAISYNSTYGNGFPPGITAIGNNGTTTINCTNAELIDTVLTGGTKSRTALQISDEQAMLGAQLGAFSNPPRSASIPSPSNGSHPSNGSGNGQPRLRDQLCLLIRQYNLDPNLVKAYAADFCGTEALSGASRELVESFIAHLAAAAKEDRAALVCKLNSYAQPVEAQP
jgi:type IV pilus assembly protein PilA